MSLICIIIIYHKPTTQPINTYIKEQTVCIPSVTLKQSKMKYLFLNSQDSKSTHPLNNPYDFTIDLPQPLIHDGKWKCALAEIGFSQPIDQDLYVYCDICDFSYVNDSHQPILRIVRGSRLLTEPFFMPIINQHLTRIRVYIKDETGQIPSVALKQSRCTLLIKYGK